MHLKRGDPVKLLPLWTFAQSRSAPVWGGPSGYRVGRVMKTITGEHDVSKHIVVVEWPDGSSAGFPERVLAKASDTDIGIAADSIGPAGPVTQDIFLLIRTSSGNFAVNAVECYPCGLNEKFVPYASIVTKHTLPTIDNSDYNLLGTMMSFADYTEIQCNSLFAAVSHLFSIWNFPELKSLDLPLPEFPSIREAAALAPDGPAALLFHLPKSFIDYADAPSPF